MFARGVFSIYPPRLLASSCFPSKPFVSPTYKITVRNSFVSPTYAKTGGCTPLKMSAKNVGAPTFSLSFLPIPPRAFQSLAHSFVFRSTPISCLHSAFRTLSPKTGGVPPLVRPIAFLYSPVRSSLFLLSCRLSTVGCLLLLHSPPIHNPVTAPSPILLPLLSQCSPVRGPTHTPCLSLSERLRYTSTNAIRPARSAHEARTDH